MIVFDPFWTLMQKRNISIYALEYTYNLNPAEISRLKNNHNFTLRSLDRYCEIFDVQLFEIIEYRKNSYNEEDR